MSVNNGDAVSAEITNAAFMSRTENTDTVGSVGLLKPTGSGALILDAQKTINNVIAATGMADQDATTLEFTGTTHIVDGTIKDALEDLDAAIVADEGDLAAHMLDNSTHGVGEIVGTTESQVLTNKDIDGGTASNTSRITLPKAAKATLDGLTRKEGTVVYASDEDKVYYDDGSILKAVGSGSGGGVNFITNGDAEAGTAGWVTYNAVLTASAFASTDAASTTVNHNIPSAVYDIKVKILSVSTACGLTVGNTYYAVHSSPTFLIFTNTPAGPAVDITADATITFAEIRPRVPAGTANITWTNSSINPLIGANSFLLTKDAVNRQYQGVMYDFTIDSAYKAKVLKIEADYIVNSGTFVAGSRTTDSDVIVYIYDVTNSTLIEPSIFKFLSNSTTISDKFSATFQTSATGTQYRLIFHVASTSTAAYALKIDNVSVSPSQYVYGTPITDWQSYTPTISWVSNVSSNGAFWRRVGDSLEVQGNLALSGAPTSADLSISIPSGLTINVAKLNGGIISNKESFGTVSILDSGNRFYIGEVVSSGTATSVIITHTESGNFGTVNATNPITFGASDAVGYKFSVPILGWSSSVQVSDGYEGRVIAGTLIKTANQSIPNGTFTKLTWDSAFLNKGDITSAANGRFEIKSAGTYVFNVETIFDVNSTGFREVQLYKNGGTQVFSLGNRVGSSTTDIRINGSSPPLEAIAGDYFEIYVYQNSGGALNIIGSYGGTYNNFSAYKLPGSPTISATETVSALYTGAPPTGTLGAATNLVTFGTKVNDTHGAYASGIYTVPVSGLYDIEAQIGAAGTYSVGQLVTISISIDNSTAIAEGISYSPVTGGVTLYPKVIIGGYPLRAGQTIRLNSYCQATGTSFSTSAWHNHLSITKRK